MNDRLQCNLATAAFILFCTSSSTLSATELAECNVDFGLMGGGIHEHLRSSKNRVSVIDVRGNLRNGEEISYSKNEPVLVADLTVTKIMPSMVPKVDFSLKSSWMLSPNFKFKAGIPLDIPTEVSDKSGRVLHVVGLKPNYLVLLDDDGRFCNRTMNTTSSPYIWVVGTLSQEPDVVPIEIKNIEYPGKTRSMRIIFNGISAGQISFQENWVEGSSVVSSKTISFDQFAKEINIGPFTFSVIGIDGEKVRLKYDIPIRFQNTNPIFNTNY